MRKRHTSNKKMFGMLMLVVVLLATLVFLAYKIVKFKNIKSTTSRVYTYEQDQKNINKVNQQDSANKQALPTFNSVYKNQRYAYSIAYDDSWHISNDSSETALEEQNVNGRKISVGGQTFWSNYQNIYNYSPDNKPEDFHLLGLTIYEGQGITMDELAQMLGFDAQSILKKDVFAGQKITGTEFVASGIDEKNPQVMIIFQKEQRFYVFNIGFPNGDSEAAETMENIARTLVLK